MKWNRIGSRYYPAMETELSLIPEKGIFQVIEEETPGGILVGLEKIGEKFKFDFKIYDLGIDDFLKRILDTWNSGFFRKTNKNLGIIYNGVKGTGKTIAAKILCNEVNIPTIIINHRFKGILEFIQSIDFECIVLIDEAEKVFQNNDEEASSDLLRMIDGVYSNSRKIFILTTNELRINDNLISRPSRIRYVKEFDGVTDLAITQLIKDKLVDKSLEDKVREDISNLLFNSIDIIENIISEYNIHGNTIKGTFNIPNKLEKLSLLLFNVSNRYTGESLISIEDVISIKRLIKSEGPGILKTSGIESNLLDIIKEDTFKKYNLEEILKYSEEDDIKSLTLGDFVDFWFYTEKNIDFTKTEISSNIYLTNMKSWSPQPYEGLTVDISYDDYVISEIKEGVIKFKIFNDETEEFRFGILL